MDRRTRIFLIICLVAFCSSFVVQTAFQFLGAERSVWGGNPGWQREIAFWNVGAAIIVFLTLRRGSGGGMYTRKAHETREAPRRGQR